MRFSPASKQALNSNFVFHNGHVNPEDRPPGFVVQHSDLALMGPDDLIYYV